MGSFLFCWRCLVVRAMQEIEICHREAVAYTDMYMRKKEVNKAKGRFQIDLEAVISVGRPFEYAVGQGGKSLFQCSQRHELPLTTDIDKTLCGSHFVEWQFRSIRT